MSHPREDGNTSVIGHPAAAIGYPTRRATTRYGIRCILYAALVMLFVFFIFAFITTLINAPPFLPNFKLQPFRSVTFPSTPTATFHVPVDFSLQNPSPYSTPTSYDHIAASLFYNSIPLSTVTLTGQRNPMTARFLVPMSLLHGHGHSLSLSARFTVNMSKEMKRGSMTVECDHVMKVLVSDSTMMFLNDGSTKCYVGESNWVSYHSFERMLRVLVGLAYLCVILLGLLLGYDLYA